MKQLIISMVSLTVIVGCVSDHQTEIPDHITNLENLTVHPADSEPESTIELIHEITFGSTDEHLIGVVGSIAVDDSDRIFISDWAQITVHILDSDGNFIKRIGREGEGPGEFMSGPMPHINPNSLSLHDYRLQRSSFYNLESLEFSHMVDLNRLYQTGIEEISIFSSILFFPRNDGMMLAGFEPMRQTMPGQAVDNDVSIVFYLIDEEGRLASDKLFEQKAREWLSANVSGSLTTATGFPFVRKTLIDVTDDGYIFSAWSEDFLIEVRNPDGDYLRAFYHPFSKRGLTRDEAIESTNSEMRKNLARNAELPDTYPVLNSMLVDDENRLWVSAIIDSDDVYEWWVLHDTGEVIAKFEWPRDESIEVVRNGNLYTRQTDEETGIAQINRYRIEMQ